MAREPRYTIEARRILRDGVAIAHVSGVSKIDGGVGRTPYSIGSPSLLDDFARRIVEALNVLDAIEGTEIRAGLDV